MTNSFVEEARNLARENDDEEEESQFFLKPPNCGQPKRQRARTFRPADTKSLWPGGHLLLAKQGPTRNRNTNQTEEKRGQS